MLSVIPAPKKAKELGGVFVLPARLKVKSDFDLPLLEGRVDFCENESDATVVIIKNHTDVT